MDFAFVLDNQGNPLKPSKRLGHVQHCLHYDMAKILFAIQQMINDA